VSIILQYAENSSNVKMAFVHSHKYYEIYYLINGNRNYFIGDKVYKITSGDFILIPPDLLHKTFGSKFERLLVYFDKESVPPSLFSALDECLDSVVISVPTYERKDIEALLNKMHTEYSSNLECREMIISSLLNTLIIEMIRLKREGQEPQYKNDSVTNLIMNIVTHINNNYMENITIDTLANMAYLSRSHFCRQFKKVTGFSPLEYLNSVRLKAAEHLLDTTALSVTTISSQVGFSSSNYFGDIFKRYKGMSPRSYRKTVNQNIIDYVTNPPQN